MKKSVFGFVLALLTLNAYAQKNTLSDMANFRNWAIGITFGPAISTGDLINFEGDKNEEVKDGTGGFEPAIGIHADYMFSPVFGLRLAYDWASMSGTRDVRSFEGSMNQVDLEFVISILNIGPSGGDAETNFALLATAGVGFGSFNPTTFTREQEVRDFDPVNAATVPLSLTAKWKLNNKFDLDLGVRYIYIASDYADGLQAGKSNDGLAIPFVGFRYNFGKDGEKSAVHFVNPYDEVFGAMAETKAKMDAMSTDDDGDGVANMMDKDNATPAGAIVDGSGKAVDSDRDGVPDFMDMDPFSNIGSKVNSQGVENDQDQDGVADSRDLEPNTPAGSMVTARGQKITSGGGGSGAVGFTPSVYFPVNGTTMSAQGQQQLAIIAKQMIANPNLKYKVIGYTDKSGSESYNQKLGERRAKAVVKELVNGYGIDSSRLTVESKGKSELLGTRSDVNRRVDFEPMN